MKRKGFPCPLFKSPWQVPSSEPFDSRMAKPNITQAAFLKPQFVLLSDQSSCHQIMKLNQNLVRTMMSSLRYKVSI